LDEPETVALLVAEDEQRSEQRKRSLLWVSLPVGILLGALGGWFAPKILPIPFGLALQAILLMTLLALLLQQLLQRVLPAPRRFPELVDDRVTLSVKQAAGAMRLAEAKKPLLALGLLLLIGLGLSVASFFSKRAAQQQAAQRLLQAGLAWANLSHCLLGDALSPGETILERTRRIELGPERAIGTWPERCGRFADALFSATAPRGPSAKLNNQLLRRFGCDPRCSIDAPARQLPGLAELAVEAGLSRVTPTTSAPRMSGRLIDKTKLPALAIPRANLEDQQLLDDGSVRLLFSLSRSSRQVCTVAPDGEIAVTCRGSQATDLDSLVEGFVVKRGSDSAGSYRLVERVGGTEKRTEEFERTGGMSRPFLLADHVAWFGERIGKSDALFARPINKSGAQLLGEKRAMIDRAGLEGRPRRCRSGTDWVALFGKRRSMAMVFASASGKWAGPQRLTSSERAPKAAASNSVSTDSASAPPRLRADAARQKALREAKEFGMIGLLGGPKSSAQPPSPWGRNPLGDKPSTLWGRSGKERSRRTRRQRRERAGRSTSRARRRKLVRRPLSCRGQVGTLSWREPSGNADRIVRWRCTPEGCKRQMVRLSGLDVQAWWIAASLFDSSGNETMLLVWRSTAGDVRMRSGPFDELQQAPDVPLLDSHKYGGPRTHELQAFVGHSAVVFLFRGIGYHALRIGADSAFSLLRPNASKPPPR